MDNLARHETALAFGAIAQEAGKAILAAPVVTTTDVAKKPDGSPVTRADLDADGIIRSRLAAFLPGVPVVSEENVEAWPSTLPAQFILVDPLDGTREFVAGRPEYTVNIGLIEAGQPIVGAIYAPALRRLYVAGAEAFRTELRPDEPLQGVGSMRLLTTSTVPERGLRAVASRSHLDPETKQWLDQHRVTELCSIGSSLKFCMIAEGEADVYPRLAPTNEWDTAAGHAILSAAGGCVLGLDGSPIRYGKSGAKFRNGPFVAWGQPQV